MTKPDNKKTGQNYVETQKRAIFLSIPPSPQNPFSTLEKGFLIKDRQTTDKIGLMQNVEKSDYPYRLPLIREEKTKTGKNTFVVDFAAWHLVKNKLQRKRLNCENKLLANKLAKEITQKLKAGMLFRKNLDKTEIQFKTILNIADALHYIDTVYFVALRKKSANNYRYVSKTFLKFLESKNLHLVNAKAINSSHIVLFWEYILALPAMENISKNNVIERTRTLFSYMQQSQIISTHPVKDAKIKALPVEMGRNIAYTTAQVNLIKNCALNNNTPSIWRFIQFMYYGFLRPDEIRQLQINDIDLDRKKITIRKEITKIKRTESIDIPAGLLPTLYEMNVDKLPMDYFLFGRDGLPAKPLYVNNIAQPIVSKNYYSTLHLNIIRKLGFSKDYTLYSWKHTGVMAAYLANKDIKAIQHQCRHKSIADTDIYLKSLGLYDNHEAFKNMVQI
jgi:integrase